jgi:hypothetical protein
MRVRPLIPLGIPILFAVLFVGACAGLTRVQSDAAVRAQQGRSSFDEETDSRT